jgi:hypothetical protein
MTTLQDIMGLITKRKIKTPSDNDYIISAAYTDTQERLKPQPKMEASLLSLNGIKKYVLASIAPPKYKVFTALLTQSGTNTNLNNNYQNQIPLVIGVSYYIEGNLPLNQKGTDFTNVGAPNNDNGTWFIATGTTPIWGTEAGEAISNEAAPAVIVLENTIGNVWFTYGDIGKYEMNSDGLFPLEKTAIPNSTFYSYNSESVVTLSTPSFETNTNNKIGLTTSTVGNVPLALLDSLLTTPIFFEVRVYN